MKPWWDIFLTSRKDLIGRRLAKAKDGSLSAPRAGAKEQAHPQFPNQMVFAVFEAERSKPIEYRGPFDSYRSTQTAVSKTCLVRFDQSKYVHRRR